MSQQPYNVTPFQNGMVMVLDAAGEQITALQGSYNDAVPKLKAADLSQCQFELGVRLVGSFKVSQAEFFDPSLLEEWTAFKVSQAEFFDPSLLEEWTAFGEAMRIGASDGL